MAGVVKFSEATNLGIHSLAVLARLPAGEARSAASLATTLRCSKNHLNKVMQRLVQVELVRAQRGPSGGFRLARPGQEIMLLEIVEAIDGPLKGDRCLQDVALCETGCALGAVVHDAYRRIHQVLAKTPVAALPPLGQRRATVQAAPARAPTRHPSAARSRTRKGGKQ